MSTVTHPSTRAGKVGESPARPSASSQPQLHPAYCFLAAPVALALGVAGLVVADDVTAAMVVGLVLVALWAGAGLALGVRRREDRLAPIAFAAALLGGAWLLMAGLATGDDSFIVDLGVRLAAALLPALAFHLLVSLPGGRLVTSSRKGVVLAGYVARRGRCGVVLMSDRDELLVWPLALAWLAALGLGLVASHGRYREAGAVDRRRMQWIGWALAVGAEAVLVIVALEVLADWPDDPAIVALALTGLVPLSLIAGTYPKLIGRIDRVLTYTVSLAGLTALIVVVYVVVVVGLARRPEEGERSLLLLSMLAAGIAALLYLPARRWLTERANRLVYGERVAPDETLRTFGQRLTRAIPLDELLLQLAESLRKSLALTSAEIWTGAGGHLELAAGVPHHEPPPLLIGEKELAVVARAGVSGGTWLDIWLPGLVAGRAPATVRVSPIAHAGALLGLIVCSRRVDGEAFTERDDLVLTELARQVGLALHNVQLDAALQASLEELQLTNTELLQSRARIVAAGDAERRKLERNLHDGAQQHLVALAVKIRLARDAVEDDPADAVAMLDEVKTDVQDAIQELRALAHGIFPPLLVSGGLTEALRAAGGRSPLPTTVETEGVGRYHQDVEAAIYFCCLEAMQNAAKHAGDRCVAQGPRLGRGRHAVLRGRRRRSRLRSRRGGRRRARVRQHG